MKKPAHGGQEMCMNRLVQAVTSAAESFMTSLDSRTLEVGDGSDGRPIWIAVDVENRRTYKIYSNGTTSGFGNGFLRILVNGPDGEKYLEQVTADGHVSIAEERNGMPSVTLYKESGDRS